MVKVIDIRFLITSLIPQVELLRSFIYTEKNLGSKNLSVGVNFTNVWEYQRNVLRKDDIEWFEDVYVPMIKKEREFEYLL